MDSKLSRASVEGQCWANKVTQKVKNRNGGKGGAEGERNGDGLPEVCRGGGQGTLGWGSWGLVGGQQGADWSIDQVTWRG